MLVRDLINNLTEATKNNPELLDSKVTCNIPVDALEPYYENVEILDTKIQFYNASKNNNLNKNIAVLYAYSSVG